MLLLFPLLIKEQFFKHLILLGFTQLKNNNKNYFILVSKKNNQSVKYT
jgi:hypothetical protein